MDGYVRCASIYCMTAATEWICSIPVCPGHLEDLTRHLTINIKTVERTKTLIPERWPSVVYYVTWRGLGVVKIGTSTKLSHRLLHLNKQSRSPMVLAAEPGGHKLERARHKEFGSLRQLGSDGSSTELFRNCPALEDHIRAVQREYPHWEYQARV